MVQIYKKAVRETKSQRDKERKRQRDKETKRQRDKERKGQRDKESKRQRVKETKRGREEERKGLREGETKGRRGEMSENEGEKRFFRKNTEKDLHISKYVRTFAPQLREQPHN